jgi:hypothetical protein
MRNFLFLLLTLFVCENAFSHARLLSAPPPGQAANTFMSPKPRDTETGYKLGRGDMPPCGNNTASATLAQFTQGQKIKFQWEETINHPGYFMFQLSKDGVNFTTIGEYIDDQNGGNNTPHLYPSAAQANFLVTLPADVTCEKCVIRFIQHMDDIKAVHANVLDGNDYFSCADIKIAAAAPVPNPDPVPPPPPPPPPTGNNDFSIEYGFKQAAGV